MLGPCTLSVAEKWTGSCSSLSPTTLLFFLCWKTLAADSWGEGKTITWIQASSLTGASKSLASLDQNEIFPSVSKSISLPSFSFHLSSLDFQRGWGGWNMPSECTLCLPALFLLAKAFRKSLVEISKIQWIYIFNCSVPTWHKQIIFLFSNSFGHEQFFASVFNLI